jgi:hypothetical protein
MDIKNLKVDHTYLLRYRMTGTISSVTILLVTETSYHCRWNNGLHINQTWELKEHIEGNYNLTEDITNLVKTDSSWVKNLSRIDEVKPIKMVSTKLVTCYVCKGFGVVPDSNSTAGGKTCPACNGAKMIPEVITPTQEE